MAGTTKEQETTMRPRTYYKAGDDGTISTKVFTARSKARAWGGFTDATTARRMAKPDDTTSRVKELAGYYERIFTRDALRKVAGQYDIAGRGAMNKEKLAVAVATVAIRNN